MHSGERRGDSALTVKICLAGDMAVGKSSLLRRFVTNTFDDKYVSTLGAKVGSRKFQIPDPRHPGQVVEVGASIWDLMGNAGFREVLKEAYFHGAKGVMLVCDGTRPETFKNLPSVPDGDPIHDMRRLEVDPRLNSDLRFFRGGSLHRTATV